MKKSILLIALLSAWGSSAMATTFIAKYVTPGPILPAAPAGRPAGTLAPGLYVQVLDGQIKMTNSAGAQNFSAGQFGFVPNVNATPVVVPSNPILVFSPPPAFSMPSPMNGGAPAKTSAVDCEVR
ncbi:hypothetical protein [Hydrogenophaga sp.]|uniref:hypothetical protein n=1 Tax=Hydrogenophaga sp. TaxID=1904254 RepID=UPI002FC84A34